MELRYSTPNPLLHSTSNYYQHRKRKPPVDKNLPLLLSSDNNRRNRRRLSAQLGDREPVTRRHLRSRDSLNLGSVADKLLLDNRHRRLQGIRRAGQVGDLEHVDCTEAVLNVARVELDDALDAVEVCDGNVERVLDNHESYALCAGWRGERAAVLKDVRGRDLGKDVGEVDACGDSGLGARGGDGGEGRGEGFDDGGGFAG
jgi:hypothetical protein